MLYQTYLELFEDKKIKLGLSDRLPDYANKYWLNQLEKAVLDGKTSTFLDIGAGSGRLSILLAKTYFKSGTAIEVEVNQEIWDILLNESTNIQLLTGEVQKSMEALGENKFDFILLSESFEHIPLPDVSSFIVNLRHLLADDGRLFITTPNFYVQGPAEESPFWHERLPYGHYKHYTYQEIANLFESNDFKVIWHCFESHWWKTLIYNRIYYPISQWDCRFLYSQKMPRFLATIYRYMSYPFIKFINGCFYLMSQIVLRIEINNTSENTSSTLMVLLAKKSDLSS